MSRLALLCVTGALLTACAGSPRHGDLRFVDSDTAAKARYAAYVAEQASAQASTRVVASTLARTVPVVLALMQHDAETVDELEERLAACAVQAEQLGNARFFRDRPPTRQECSEVVEHNPCGKPVTRAMSLGKQKHVLALQCAEEVLKQLWPAPFSIEQRYRYYPNARMVETVSRREEARLISDGCTDELRGTIKPDLVLHADHNLLKAALILDFKFPCPNTNVPQWSTYGPSSPYSSRTQGDVYEAALGGPSMIISPATGVATP